MSNNFYSSLCDNKYVCLASHCSCNRIHLSPKYMHIPQHFQRKLNSKPVVPFGIFPYAASKFRIELKQYQTDLPYVILDLHNHEYFSGYSCYYTFTKFINKSH